MHMQSLIRAASATVGAAALALAIPAAASAATARPDPPPGLHPHPPVMSNCHTTAAVVMDSPPGRALPVRDGMVHAVANMVCQNPERGQEAAPVQQVNLTLYRDGKFAAQNGQECLGSGHMSACRSTTRMVPHTNHVHRWCAVATASAGKTVHQAARECLVG